MEDAKHEARRGREDGAADEDYNEKPTDFVSALGEEVDEPLEDRERLGIGKRLKEEDELRDGHAILVDDGAALMDRLHLDQQRQRKRGEL